VNLPKFNKICKYDIPQLCNIHSEFVSSVQLSLLVQYIFPEKENQTFYSLQQMLTFASQPIQTKIISILIQVQKLICNYALHVTYSGVIKTLAE
jgi:hypothetical protein